MVDILIDLSRVLDEAGSKVLAGSQSVVSRWQVIEYDQAANTVRTTDERTWTITDGVGTIKSDPTNVGQGLSLAFKFRGRTILRGTFKVPAGSSVRLEDLERLDPNTLTEGTPGPAWITELAAVVAALASKLDTDDLDDEAAALLGADPSALKTALTAQIEQLVAGLNLATIVALNNAITAEVTARNSAISTAVSTEVTNRNTAITSAINGEVTARNSAISTAINSLVASAPGTLDTLKELADALGDDPNFAATMTTALAQKLDQGQVDTRITSIGGGQFVGGVAVVGGNGTTDDRAALVTADTAASSSRPILFRGPGTYRIASNFTTTAPVIVQPGAKIRPDNGVVVKLGRVLASDGQCFDHSAGGIVAPTRVDYYLPQWWGTLGTANDTAAWQAAANAADAVKVTDTVTARSMMQRILAPAGSINRIFGLTLNGCTIVADKGSTDFYPAGTPTSGSMITLGALASIRGGYWRSNATGAATLIDVQGARSIVSDCIVEPRATDSVGINLGSGSSITPTVTNTEIIGATKLGKGMVVNSADAKMSDITLAQCALGIDWQRGAARVSNLHAWGNGTGMTGNPDGIEGSNWFVESNDGWGIDWNSADYNILMGLRLWANGAVSGSAGGMRLLHSGFGTRGNRIDAVVDDNTGDGILVDGSSANIITVQIASRERNAGRAAVGTNGVRVTATSAGGAASAGNKIVAKGRSTDVLGSVVANASSSTDVDLGSVKVVMPADVVVNSTTNPTNPATLLSIPMERGEKWLIEGSLVVDSDQAADFKLRLQATSLTASSGRFAVNSPVGASNTSLTAASMNPSNAQSIATSLGAYVASGGLGVGVVQAVTISGYIETGTADGSLELQAMQNTVGATNTTFRAGSWLRASRIA